MSTQIYLLEAETLPSEVYKALPEIAEDAAQAVFALIAARLGMLGFRVTGDFSPDEVEQIEAAMKTFVRAIALNNEAIAGMQRPES